MCCGYLEIGVLKGGLSLDHVFVRNNLGLEYRIDITKADAGELGQKRSIWKLKIGVEHLIQPGNQDKTM